MVSRMYGHGLPLASTLCEKSPRRSRAVGTRVWRSVAGSVRRWCSWLKKKNSFFLFWLKPGKNTGPPMVKPWSLRDVFGIGISGMTRLLVQLLAFHSERRPYQ